MEFEGLDAGLQGIEFMLKVWVVVLSLRLGSLFECVFARWGLCGLQLRHWQLGQRLLQNRFIFLRIGFGLGLGLGFGFGFG